MNTKIYLIFFALLLGTAAQSQVGVNTTSPKTTMDVSAKRANTDGTGLIDNSQTLGLLAPRVTRAELSANNGTYGINQAGALIFVTDVTGGDNSGIRINVTAPGYYYYDSGANQWKSIGSGGSGATSLLTGTGLASSGTGATATPYNVDLAAPVKFFYMPSISISTAASGSVDLYALYSAQFGTPQAKNPGAPAAISFFPSAAQLNYYVTSYDTSVLTVTGITDTGLLSYTITGTPATACSFMNIVFVPK